VKDINDQGSPRKLIINNLTNDINDIEGARSKKLTILSKSNRITNPLNPN